MSERMLTQPQGIRGSMAAIKRILDLAGALIAIPLFAPLMIAAAFAIGFTSRGPILFIQQRVGEHGKLFRMLKLRTMIDGAEEQLDNLVDLDSLAEPAFKLKPDPRVTRVGRFLRRWSIDELPQLFNVLKGDMSLVGPRPEEVRVVRYYNSWHRRRLAVKPGLTGPAQISGRADLALHERVRLEIDYIENYSLLKDLQMLLRTIPVVLRGDGCY